MVYNSTLLIYMYILQHTENDLSVLRLAFTPKMPGRVDGASLSLTSHIWGRERTEARVLEGRFKDSCLSLCSPASSHLAVL